MESERSNRQRFWLIAEQSVSLVLEVEAHNAEEAVTVGYDRTWDFEQIDQERLQIVKVLRWVGDRWEPTVWRDA